MVHHPRRTARANAPQVTPFGECTRACVDNYNDRVMLTVREMDEVKEYVLANLPKVLEQDPRFVVFIEGIVAEKFPRRDEFTRALDEWTNFRHDATKRFDGIDKRFDHVDGEISVLKTDVSVLKTDVSVLKTDMARVKGGDFEDRVRRNAQRWVSRDHVRGRMLDANQLHHKLAPALADARINDDEADDLGLADGVIMARARSNGTQAWFVVEASVVIDVHDVQRAARRAAVFARATAPEPVFGSVVGERITAGASALGAVLNVEVNLFDPDGARQ